MSKPVPRRLHDSQPQAMIPCAKRSQLVATFTTFRSGAFPLFTMPQVTHSFLCRSFCCHTEQHLVWSPAALAQNPSLLPTGSISSEACSAIPKSARTVPAKWSLLSPGHCALFCWHIYAHPCAHRHGRRCGWCGCSTTCSTPCNAPPLPFHSPPETSPFFCTRTLVAH